ncbi:MAG TPA: hypothetical protein VHD62_09625 [Opitutaceae bacterium]|nr:hypothetical protein [Opitutaceae bacterium]
MSVTVTRFVRSLDSVALLDAYGDTAGVQAVNLPVRFGRPFDPAASGVGARFHEAFQRFNRGEPIQREFLPYARALHEWLRLAGARRMWTEWSYGGEESRWRGTVDVSVAGGPRPSGIVEIKLQGRDPEDGFCEDWAQLGCYCRLAAEAGRPIDRQWAALAYILPRRRQVRVLVQNDVWRLVAPLARLEAA